MTYEEIAAMVEEIGLPWAYYEFPEGTEQAPPFICFFYPERNDFLADDANYQRIERLRIELYTAEKDFEKEAAVESVLEDAGMVYESDEERLDDEQMFMKVYEMEVVINA